MTDRFTGLVVTLDADIREDDAQAIMTARKPKPVPTVKKRVAHKYGGDLRLSGSELEGTPDEIIAKMNALKAEYPDKTLTFEWEQERYEDSYSLYLYETRPETDEEKEERLAETRSRREAQEAYERRQLEILQNKYKDK